VTLAEMYRDIRYRFPPTGEVLLTFAGDRRLTSEISDATLVGFLVREAFEPSWCDWAWIG
jgi:hypothetical protein